MLARERFTAYLRTTCTMFHPKKRMWIINMNNLNFFEAILKNKSSYKLNFENIKFSTAVFNKNNVLLVM